MGISAILEQKVELFKIYQKGGLTKEQARTALAQFYEPISEGIDKNSKSRELVSI